ncbi:MAG: phosphoglucosamine mutase [Micrococcales bacterium]|nr:phosphoglucosamine mutase [Micrococcales bacterium]
MPRLFGTDGVRGLAGRDITAELALHLASAAARVLAAGVEGRRGHAIIGADSRISGGYLAAAVGAGLAEAGMDVLDAGMLPTPGLAYLAASGDVDLAVMLSASHNPMEDNGIKFFARGGNKVPDRVEDEIEALLNSPWERPTGAEVGRITQDPGAVSRYVDHVVRAAPKRLDGLSVVLDCANGAASEVGPAVFSQLGARVFATGCEPDGLNINAGVGSTHPEALSAAVVAHGADAGFAFDGDADRCLAVDADGELVSGDHILAILALALRERGALAHDTVVATIMSNLGFHHAMTREGISVVTTCVGDRYVLEEMLAQGHSLGGEQSGHVIISEHSTTGDGLLTAVQLASRMTSTRRTMADLASVMEVLPQTLVNVGDVDKRRTQEDAEVQAAVSAAKELLGGSGRVLLRPSGTEPLVRVMVEATTQVQADEVAGELARVVRERLGLSA